VETATRTRRITLVAVLGLGALAIVLLTVQPAVEPGRPDADGRLEVTIEGYRVDVDTWRLPAEQPITLVVVNRDEVSHPLSFGRGDIEDDLLRTVGYEEDLFAGLEPRVTPTTAIVEPRPPNEGFTVQVAPLGTTTVEVTFPTDRIGTWHAGCFLGRGCHLAAGVRATVVIEP
jgi:hypothetical protein